jgi:hypothetical protein
MPISAHHAVMERIRAEYLEMPGMSLKVERVQRLCGVERAACAIALDSLVAMKFLYKKADGAYPRLSAESGPRPQPAKVRLMKAPPVVRLAS